MSFQTHGKQWHEGKSRDFEKKKEKKEKWQKRDVELNQAVLAYLLGLCIISEKWAKVQGGQQISEANRSPRLTYDHSAEDMHRNEGPPPSKTLPSRAGPGWALALSHRPGCGCGSPTGRCWCRPAGRSPSALRDVMWSSARMKKNKSSEVQVWMWGKGIFSSQVAPVTMPFTKPNE